MAPGVRYPLPDRVHMIHNLLKSHGRAVQVLRELVPGVRVAMPPRVRRASLPRIRPPTGRLLGKHISGSVKIPKNSTGTSAGTAIPWCLEPTRKRA